MTGCRDINDDCDAFMRAGNCTDEATVGEMLSTCPHSRGICNIGDCYDSNPKCYSWAERGECQKNPLVRFEEPLIMNQKSLPNQF